MAKTPDSAPVPSGRSQEPATTSTRGEIDAFLDESARTERRPGRRASAGG